MKNLLLLLMLTPTLIFGQVSSWRNGGNATSQQHRVSTPQIQQPQQPNMSSWRVNPPIHKDDAYRQQKDYQKPPRTIYNPYSLFPYYGPYGWYSPSIIYYNDFYGYRNRARVYTYEYGRRDTVKVEPIHFSFGIQGTNNKQVGGWVTVGNRGYFIVDISSTNISDNSTYFPHGQIQNVDFPIIGNVNNIKTFYVGIGKKVQRTGFHVMIGNVNEDVRYKGKDALGLITFPNYKSSYVSAKVGMIHDFKTITIKLDFDPFTKVSTYGIGINL